MGVDPSRLGPAYKKAAKAERAAGRPPMDSQLEARFVTRLKLAKVPKWARNQRIPPMGTKHEADFMWTDVPARGERKSRRHLVIFIDGGVHKLRLSDDCRRDCLCSFLPPEWTCLRFADNQLDLGAKAVKLWHLGKMEALLEALREWRAP